MLVKLIYDKKTSGFQVAVGVKKKKGMNEGKVDAEKQTKQFQGRKMKNGIPESILPNFFRRKMKIFSIFLLLSLAIS
jgi:hypothetical protein